MGLETAARDERIRKDPAIAVHPFPHRRYLGAVHNGRRRELAEHVVSAIVRRVLAACGRGVILTVVASRNCLGLFYRTMFLDPTSTFLHASVDTKTRQPEVHSKHLQKHSQE